MKQYQNILKVLLQGFPMHSDSISFNQEVEFAQLCYVNSQVINM